MILLIGSITIGLILSLLAMGILISFRVVAFEDLTVDGSLTLGGAVVAALIVSGTNPWLATGIACLAGSAAGVTTALLHTRCKVNRLLAGILVMTALYSVNLRIMGRSNIPLLAQPTLLGYAESLAKTFGDGQSAVQLGRWEIPAKDLGVLIVLFGGAILAGIVLYTFFQTNLGLAMRAVGDNSQMICALGVDVGWMTTLGLALANGLNALAGALLAQYQGFADVQMGIGMLVWGVASVILGESLVGTRQIGLLITGAIMGSILFRLLVAIALRWGLNPNDLKLVTAAFVFAAMVIPNLPSLLGKGAKQSKNA
jgi:putative ABC transport system permease protein